MFSIYNLFYFIENVSNHNFGNDNTFICFCYSIVRLQPATLLKVALLHRCFLRSLNCKNGTKSSQVSHYNLKVALLPTGLQTK